MISGTRYQLRLEMNRQLRLAEGIARDQAEISSGKRILAPSDDPAATARISEIARTQANEATWRTNLDQALALSQNADTALASLNLALDRAKELMIGGSTATLSPQNRAALALELDSIAEAVTSLRDTRDARGELLFPAGRPIGIPVGPDLTITAVPSSADVFDTVGTAAGPASIVGLLTSAAAALRSNDPTAIATARTAVENGVDHVIAERGRHGSRGSRIDALAERSATTALRLTEERGALEGADIIEVVSRLQAKELSLEAAQAAFARINRSNLFDLIR